MAQLKYCDKHNQVGFLFKSAESAGYTEIVDFLRRSKLRYALTHNPPIYDSLVKQFWQTATARTLADGTQQLNATIDSIEYTITEESVRRQLQLADASGINMLQNEEIFAGLQNIGSKSGGWDQFGSNIATALICLSTGRDFNFSKLIFDGMIPTPPITSTPPSTQPPTLTQHVQSTTPPLNHQVQPQPKGPSFEPSYHMSPPPSHEPENQTSRTSEESEQLRNLLDLVPRLESRVESLEKELSDTKQTLGTAVLKLLKKRGRSKTIPSQKRNKEMNFATPKKSKILGEASSRTNSPFTLDRGCTILTNVASEGFKGSQAPPGSKILKAGNPNQHNSYQEITRATRASRYRAAIKDYSNKWMLKHKDKFILMRFWLEELVEQCGRRLQRTTATEFDYIQARLNADQILAEKIQQEEREQYSIEDRAKFLHDTIAAQRKFLANKEMLPPTRPA
ncbi:hypothetical protein Tco_0448447 [Tanacetum coccineum]